MPIHTIAAQDYHGLKQLLSRAAYYMSALWSNVYASSSSNCLNRAMPAPSHTALHKPPNH